jgi:hypothetical protein
MDEVGRCFRKTRTRRHGGGKVAFLEKEMRSEEEERDQ